MVKTPDYYSRLEAATYHDISTTTWDALVKAGVIPDATHQIGNRKLWTAAVVEGFSRIRPRGENRALATPGVAR
jgi:hypothetical protein